MIALLLSACANPAPTLTASPTASPTTSGSAGRDLFSPGLAQEVVAELVAAAEGKPVVRVVLDRTRARLTYVDTGDRPRSMVWLAGVISSSDDGTDLVAATSFNPADFNLINVAVLFATAARLSGSENHQELQINEYDHGGVLMTITTSPESSTVFFDREGTLIPRLRLSTDAGLSIGLNDILENRIYVVAVGATITNTSASSQLWADVVATSGVLERRIRPANMPMYLTKRRETPTTTQFDSSLIDPQVVGRLIRTGPSMLGKPNGSPLTLTITQPADQPAPRITVDVGSSQLVTDLAGAPIENP